MVAVSVIIPVYNVEKYLRQCLDSVINQTLEDIEIICVDDCSTDDSFEILKEYASKDSRIVLLKQKVNQGQGVARNLALEIANGDYIMFCDPDDWYELNTCEIAFNEISKNRTDMALFFYNRYFEEDKKYFPDNARYQRYSRIVEQKIDINTNKNFSIVDFFIVNQIYSRHFINQYKIRFDSCRMFEDQHFMGMAYIYANKIYIINAFLYNYRIRNNSTTFTCQYAYKDLFRISHYLISLLLDVKDSKIFIATFLSYRLRTILWWWGFYSKYGKAIQRDFYSRFKEFLIYIFSKLDIDSYKEEIGTYYYKQIESIIKLNFYML